MPIEITEGAHFFDIIGRMFLNELKEIVEKKGGKIISTEYVRNNEKMMFQCGKGHQWKTTYQIIKRGNWCPQCSNRGRNKRYKI